MIKISRIYDEPNGGFRILVDRLWPRGISKEKARIDLWLKEIAPSTDLRQWFSHDVNKWDEFKKRYLAELKLKESQKQQIKKLEIEQGSITLVYGARDREHNHAIVLKSFLESN